MPDNGDRIRLEFHGKSVRGGGFLQSCRPTTGKVCGKFADGRLAVIENSFGKGKTLLIGIHPGVAYFKDSNAENLAWFADALP